MQVLFKNNRTLFEQTCIQKVKVPIGLMGMLDYMWFILLVFTTLFLPDSPPLRFSVALEVASAASMLSPCAHS